MPWRFFGKAKADPSSPRAAGFCDRCDTAWQLSELKWQYQWRGAGLANTMFRVCPRCIDVPSAFLKALNLPADPVPVSFPRPGFVQEEMNQGQNYTNWDIFNQAWDTGESWDSPQIGS